MTTAIIRRPSLTEFQKYSRTEGRALVLALLAARAFAQVERKRVDAYIQPIFAEYDFRPTQENLKFGEPDATLPLKYLWLTDMDAPEYHEFNERCYDAHAARGWTGERGHCPALTAEHAVTKAEWAIIESISRFLDFDFTHIYGDERKQLLDLVCGAALN